MILTNEEKEFLKQLILEGMLSHKKLMLINKNTTEEINAYCDKVSNLFNSIDQKIIDFEIFTKNINRIFECLVALITQNENLKMGERKL